MNGRKICDHDVWDGNYCPHCHVEELQAKLKRVERLVMIVGSSLKHEGASDYRKGWTAGWNACREELRLILKENKE